MPDGSNRSTQPASGSSSGHNPGRPGAKPTSSPHPKPEPAGPVTPHNLGAPNFGGYCQHIGQGSAVTTADNAYGWHCSANPALILPVQGACAWTYGLSASKVINVTTNYYSPGSWQCWRTNGILGQLNFSAYCVDAGLGSAKLTAGNAYGWACTGQPSINEQAACQFLFRDSFAFARFAVFADPYSWQCWG